MVINGWTSISVNGAKFIYASWDHKDLRNSACFAESSSWLKIFWQSLGINSNKGAVKNIPVGSITHFMFWKVHLVIPKLTQRVLEFVCVIEYHYSHGKTALMISKLLRVLLDIWYKIMPLSLGIWFYSLLVCYLPPLLRMNSGNLPLKMNKYYGEHTTCQTNSLSSKSCQMNMLPFMDLKCILNPQHHNTILWR